VKEALPARTRGNHDAGDRESAPAEDMLADRRVARQDAGTDAGNDSGLVRRQTAVGAAIGASPRVAQLARIAQLAVGSVVQRAGDPEGLMPEHHATNFTYHHIIPENKLHKLWETLEEHQHTSLLKAGLKSVASRGIDQLKSAALGNIKLDLKKEINEVVGTWDDDKYKAIVDEAVEGSNSETLVNKYFPGLEKSTHEYHSSYLPIKASFNKRFKVLGQTKGSDVAKSVGADGAGFLADGAAKTAVNQLLMWMPGNIHRGPSKRFTPKDSGWKKALDDGGDGFEDAAAKIISGGQFATLKSLNEKIDAYLGDPTSTAPLTDIGTLLDAMKSYSVTEYNPDQWVEATEGAKKSAKKAWRFKT
jgi:hypothetical protein